ncbi:MAG: hypothetical protein ACI9H8_000423 [Lysobacterales bacterium]|jgi:hypothetical protein
MNQLEETDIACPYCGETITILVDGSAGSMQYIEDCQVCCRPIEILVDLSPDGSCTVQVRAEND